MRFGRKIQEEQEVIPLAPLIDIVFLTLVFFMSILGYSSMEKDMQVQLPTADNSQQADRVQGEIYINLRSDGVIVVNNREMDVPELQEVLLRVAEHFPGGAVIIRGDQSAMLGRAIDVLNCCRKADIQNVRFAALQEETAAKSK